MNELEMLKAEKAIRDKRDEINQLKLELLTKVHDLYVKHGEKYLKDLKNFNIYYEE